MKPFSNECRDARTFTHDYHLARTLKIRCRFPRNNSILKLLKMKLNNSAISKVKSLKCNASSLFAPVFAANAASPESKRDRRNMCSFGGDFSSAGESGDPLIECNFGFVATRMRLMCAARRDVLIYPNAILTDIRHCGWWRIRPIRRMYLWEGRVECDRVHACTCAYTRRVVATRSPLYRAHPI